MKNLTKNQAINEQMSNIEILKENGFEDVEEYVLCSFYCKVYNESTGNEEYESLYPNISFQTSSELSEFVYGY